jgi:hypothetical protein
MEARVSDALTPDDIPRLLSETDPATIRQLRALVRQAGLAQALAWVEEARAIHDGPGMLTDDGTRPRTVGGIFFKLAKNALPVQQRRKLFPARPAGPPPLVWEARDEVAQTLEYGEASKVKITLIGRPMKVIPRGKIYVAGMKNDRPPTGLAPDMPAPPDDPTKYLVFLPPKPYRPAAERLAADPEDRLIVEGWGAYDPTLKTVCVWANRVTTVALQREQRPR